MLSEKINLCTRKSQKAQREKEFKKLRLTAIEAVQPLTILIEQKKSAHPTVQFPMGQVFIGSDIFTNNID